MADVIIYHGQNQKKNKHELGDGHFELGDGHFVHFYKSEQNVRPLVHARKNCSERKSLMRKNCSERKSLVFA